MDDDDEEELKFNLQWYNKFPKHAQKSREFHNQIMKLKICFLKQKTNECAADSVIYPENTPQKRKTR